MNKTTSIIRKAVMAALVCFILLCIFANPMENSEYWYSDMIVSKATAVICIIGATRLHRHWKGGEL